MLSVDIHCRRKEKHYVHINFFFFTKRRILDSSKLKEFTDDNFELDEYGTKFSKQAENTV